MIYRATARAFARAERNIPATPARILPLSALGEERRDQMFPAQQAGNHASHVSDTARALREALSDHDDHWTIATLADKADSLAAAARALLAAIGEGE